MHLLKPSQFPSDKLDDYTIVNAVEEIHYKKKTGRTEGTDSEVLQQNNMNRLNTLLSNSDNILALGDKAQLAADHSSIKGSIFKGNHPSMQALNRKYKSGHKDPSKRHEDRVEQWINQLVETKKQ